MIRAADTKAGFLVTLLLFLGASTIALAKEIVPKLRWLLCSEALTSGGYLLAYFVFTLGFAWSLALAYRVVNPRSAKHYVAPQAGYNLLYYKHVLLHKDNTEYFSALCQASPDLLLRNLADQVFELAHICEEKMADLQKARFPIALAFGGWMLNMGLGLWMTRWK